MKKLLVGALACVMLSGCSGGYYQQSNSSYSGMIANGLASMSGATPLEAYQAGEAARNQALLQEMQMQRIRGY